MRIECEDLEADIKENGWTEMFTQSANVEPYARARPEGQSYQSLNGNYQKIIRQLDSMLPAVAGNSEDDGFGSVGTGRDDPGQSAGRIPSLSPRYASTGRKSRAGRKSSRRRSTGRTGT